MILRQRAHNQGCDAGIPRPARAQPGQAAPHFGNTALGLWLTCAKWPVKSPAFADRAIRAPGTPPILLVGNTFDPATPVAWARAVHGQLANSVLVTNQGGGHGFYEMGSCTRNVVDSFLITGKKPAPGTACNDRSPAATPLTAAVTAPQWPVPAWRPLRHLI